MKISDDDRQLLVAVCDRFGRGRMIDLLAKYGVYRLRQVSDDQAPLIRADMMDMLGMNLNAACIRVGHRMSLLIRSIWGSLK